MVLRNLAKSDSVFVWFSSRKLGAHDAGVHVLFCTSYSGFKPGPAVQSIWKTSATVQALLLAFCIPDQSDTGKTKVSGNTHCTNGLGGQSRGCTLLDEDGMLVDGDGGSGESTSIDSSWDVG
jgi:hypothetical protein